MTWIPYGARVRMGRLPTAAVPFFNMGVPMATKPFRTIGEQIEILRGRGMEVDDSAAQVLMREGYYSIVNGYKAPFIDRERTLECGEDRYRDGTRFDDVLRLFEFDRALRELTFHSLIKAEAAVRTAVSYCFSDAHRGQDDYLLQSSFCTRDEYGRYGKQPDSYASELSKLIGLLGSRRDSNRAEFVVHYREEYGYVPLWVLSNDLTFGNLEHFFNLMKPRERDAVCKMISAGAGRLGDRFLGYFDASEARVSLEVLVKFRNICAHDERLYCARVGGRKDVDYSKMMFMLERYLTPNEFYEFLDSFISMLQKALEESKALRPILGPLGVKRMGDELERREKSIS